MDKDYHIHYSKYFKILYRKFEQKKYSENRWEHLKYKLKEWCNTNRMN